ncbi:MAG TPA: DinB family protein [Blastocatellia bacterium]|nr:DinB family protein [Blastocatellia bacterium]
MIKTYIGEYERYRSIGRKAIDQISDEGLNEILSAGNNSAAMIVRHISGNFLSRFTDFLTSDGEKPWRDRDAEFEDARYTREEVNQMWEEGWHALEAALAELSDDDLQKQVIIRGHSLTVDEALARSVAHAAYHVGQIVLLARILAGDNWQWISIPKGKSQEYLLNPTREKKPD